MASSSIEVLGVPGTGEVKVMVMKDSVEEVEDEEMQTIINASNNGVQMVSSSLDQDQSQDQQVTSMEDFSGLEGDLHTLQGMEPPPGTIIFSPQDLLRPGPTKSSGRGRASRGGIRSTVNPNFSMPLQFSGGGAQNLEVPVACDVCGKVMMTGKTLVQHMAIHSDLKPFQCPHCPKSFARKVHLQGHLVIHGIEKQFECPVCHQRFSRQDCVKVHMRLHDKSKCVYCDVCHKAFLTVGALNIHLRIHRGEKPFKCHLCSKCFTQKNHLITHIKRHTKVTDEHFTKKLGPRMFKCEHCPRSFIRLSDYERHVQWNHGAVADGSIVDKLPTVGNLLQGEHKQTGLAPQVFKAPKDALNSKPRTKRTRKVMCTTSTQTDDDGGHVIIPRQYQSQVSAGTQVSAPPTPRPADDDIYESDMFDEGMDRNYSSDEDEDVPHSTDEGGTQVERKVFALPDTAEMASDPIQDAAFDAIVQGSQKTSQEQEDTTAQDEHTAFLQEVVSSMTKQGLDTKDEEKDTNKKQPATEQVDDITPRIVRVDRVELEGEVEDTDLEVKIVNSEDLERGQVQHQLQKQPEQQQQLQKQPEHQQQLQKQPEQQQQLQEQPQQQQEQQKQQQMEMEQQGHEEAEVALIQNTGMNERVLESPSKRDHTPVRRGRGRGRGRGRKWSPYGLTGAAELRAIRKSMMQNLIVKEDKDVEESKTTNVTPPKAKTDTEEGSRKVMTVTVGIVEEGETEGRGKRLAKNKQHGKDFVCNMKNCETCSPKTGGKVPVKTKLGVKEESPEKHERLPPVVKKVISIPPRQPVKNVLKDINIQPEKQILGIPSNHNHMVTGGGSKVRVKIENSSKMEDKKMKVGNRVGSYPVDITANLLGRTKKEDYFVTTTNADSVLSPPVELMSCIPTYSCKLCSREFRFEGKLHRHIESVHQNKAIFSPDVKPGRGSTRVVTLPQPLAMPDISAPSPPPVKQPVEPENPEIAALRSEWDDDDDDDDDDDGEPVPVPTPTPATSAPVRTPVTAISHTPMTIVTREIAPITTTITDAYSGGVKVNMNKLAGLLPQVSKSSHSEKHEATPDGGSRVDQTRPREPETIMADTLDMKCRRLLEKLFDHDLLMQCGLGEEHVSVVLGRVLQHYGVKMIEDYGQGQYEVLKYNLWRLIEWKVTMEQMEEFYTAGKSVEEMMDDIMNEMVPLVSHHFVPQEQAAASGPAVTRATSQVATMEAVEVGDGQMVLQHVAGVLGGQLNLPEGVTQVVLSQDVSPDLLQGAHIVTIDPTTGQVISQVTADQVILADSIGDELEQQVAALDGQVVVSQGTAVQQGNLVVTHATTQPQGQVLVQTGHQHQQQHHHQQVKMETVSPSTTHHHQHQQ